MAALTDNQLQNVTSIFDSFKIPSYIWYPIMMQESGGNTGSHNPNGEDSRGLFQINIKAHPQWADVDLFDADTNATYAATYFILPAYKKAIEAGITDPGLQAEYVWKNGIRPKWSLVVEKGKDKTLREMATAISGGKASVDVPSSGGGTWLDGSSGSGGGLTSGNTNLGGGFLKDDGSFNFGLGTKFGVDFDRLFGNVLFLTLGLLLIGIGLFIAFGGNKIDTVLKVADKLA